MSNQPKIVYRSDTTGCTYQMMQHKGSFTIQAVNFDGVVIAESNPIIYLKVWRANVNNFFDIITSHINYGRWE